MKRLGEVKCGAEVLGRAVGGRGEWGKVRRAQGAGRLA